MTSTVSPGVDATLEAAANAATAALTIGEPVTFTELGASDQFAGAVSVTFTGGRTGEFALLVDEELQLTLTQGGAAALVEALRPALSAVAAAIGDVTISAPTDIDPRLGTAALQRYAEAAATAIRGAASARAAVVVGFDAAPGAGATLSNSTPAISAVASAVAGDRLDLLRGIEMQGSAELGRARMTVNELLNLRAGAVVELDRAAGDPVDLHVNGRLLARGEVVVVDENYALRITQIVTDDVVR